MAESSTPPGGYTGDPTLPIIGAVLLHLLIALLAETLIDDPDRDKPTETPEVEIVDVEVPPPPPPPIPEPEPEPEPEPAKPEPAPEPETKPQVRQPRAPPPPPDQPPPPPSNEPPSPSSGGAPVTTMENLGPDAVGNVPVAVGKRTSNKVGRGGTGGGTGSGTGTGSSDAPPAPVSVATIKKRAMPKGDFSYFDASKDYPPEAKSLGIEGQIRVRLIVDAEGAVKSAVLLNKLGHGLDELAMERAKKIKFDPALDTDDKPVSSVVVWTFNMTLPK